jgi:serine phosphatase RsbU (regulator of sigma subunit)
MLKTLILKNVVTHEINLEHLVKALNSDFNSILRETGRYSTMFLALIDKKKNEIKYASCGHIDVLYWDSNSQEFFYISSTTPILGLLERIEVYSSFIQFNQGDYLFIPTDGILTVTNREGEQLGYEGLMKILKKYLSNEIHPNELIFNLSQEIEKFGEDGEILDDMTLLAIRL